MRTLILDITFSYSAHDANKFVSCATYFLQCVWDIWECASYIWESWMRTLMYHIPHNMTNQPASKRHMGTPSSKHPSTLTKGTCVHGLPIQWWLEIHEAPGSYSTGVHHWFVPSKKQSYFFWHSVNTYCVCSHTRTRLFWITCQTS